MSDEETMSVEAEASEAAPQATETEQPQPELQESQAEQRKRNDAEYNWAEMRRQMKEKDRQIQDLENKYTQLAPKIAPQAEEDDFSNLAEDDLVSVKQVKKLAQKMARKEAEDLFKEKEVATLHEWVNSKYADYDQVVTADNIELLKQTEPELALSLTHIPDLKSQAVAAYKLLKKMAVKPVNNNILEKKKALENTQKPQSVNSIAKTSPLAHVNQFDNLDSAGKKAFYKAQYEEMQRAMRAG